METVTRMVQRAQEGDAEAYGALVRRFQDMAYGYAYAILNDFDLAQDAAQEAFIEAYQCLPALREALAFPAWLKRIVYKHCDRLTRGKRPIAVPIDEAAEVASLLPGPAEVAERRDLARRVQEAIRELPVHQRVATTLFYINGYSHQEIADFLGVPAKTVKSRLHASRGRLRERMIGMVEDELKANALPVDFTQETVEQAVAKAGKLRQEQQYDEAEELLRQVLAQFPEHPEALKELNRTLMHGRVYGEGRWELLRELAERGKAVLQTTEDEHVVHQVAVTLLAIPAMPEAAAFLEDWMARRGPNLERLGMLAWAKGCVADYEAAEALWQDLLALAQGASPDEILRRVPFVAYTLVDCFAAAGELPRVQRAARQAWELCRDLGPPSTQIAAQLLYHHGINAETAWMAMFHQAQLDLADVAGVVLARHQGSADPHDQATVLCIRNWTDNPQDVLPDWLDWVRERMAAGEWKVIESFRRWIGGGLRERGDWRALDRLAHATWELLGEVNTSEAEQHRAYWSGMRSIPLGAIGARDWAAAEEIVRRSIEENGIQGGSGWALMLAAARGVPTPPELVQAVEQNGVDVFGWGRNGWYVVAREAAATGDEARAFDALRKALSYWTNPPFTDMELWEHDVRWGTLRRHPEFKAALEEKRRRIGPVYGLLHYFPGW